MWLFLKRGLHRFAYFIYLHRTKRRLFKPQMLCLFSYGVMVARQILALKIEVRALVGKHILKALSVR